MLPIPGATRLESLRSSVRAAAIVLDDEDRERLDERFPAARQLRGERRQAARPCHRSDGEVVLVMGLPAAGKSTLAARFVRGRLPRGSTGTSTAAGSRRSCPSSSARSRPAARRFVLDNTYATRKSRAPIVERGRAPRPARALCLAADCASRTRR